MTAANLIHWLDSNVLISAKDGPFRFNVAPAFWKTLDEKALRGEIRVSKMVYEEIMKYEPQDDLANWLKNRKGNGFCVSPGKDVQAAYQDIADHVVTKYESPYVAEFLSVADPWVIAHAAASSGIVVTFETRGLGSKRVKIPDVCTHFNIKCKNLYDMLESLKVKFT